MNELVPLQRNFACLLYHTRTELPLMSNKPSADIKSVSLFVLDFQSSGKKFLLFGNYLVYGILL